MSHASGSHPRELISAWLDGELAQDERTLVIEHLADCASCRGLVDDLTILKKAQRDEPVPPVPEELEKRIAWRLRSTKAASPRARWRKLVPLTAVASVAVIGVLVVVLREQKLTPTFPAHDIDVQLKERAPEPSAPPVSDEERDRRKSLDSLGEKKEADASKRPQSLGYLGGSKNAESGAVAKQVAAAPPPAAPPPEGMQEKDDRLDQPARQAEPAIIPEMAKARAAAAPSESEVAAGGGERRTEGAAGAAPTNEERFAPAPKAAAKSLAAECRSPWSAREILEGRISRERLAGIATGLGGSVTPDASDPSLYRIDVPIGNWRAFQDALAALDFRGIDGGGVPEAGADCVRVAVRALP